MRQNETFIVTLVTQLVRS